MKKVVVIFLILVFFLIGINIGGSYHNYSKMFEDAKNEFEEEITLPDNNYEPKTLKPKEGLINKIANGIDGIIEKFTNKLR
ncbi:MAG: hypothetical protein SOZ32_01210 [Bacilli bacterium]|nr:hypothetical protein [Mollicutes bacterium]MDY3898821.1 hypothetical protein [Bacilli bacterium]